MPASPIELKNSLPDLDLNPGRREPSALQASRHCGLISGLTHWATEDRLDMMWIGGTTSRIYMYRCVIRTFPERPLGQFYFHFASQPAEHHSCLFNFIIANWNVMKCHCSDCTVVTDAFLCSGKWKSRDTLKQSCVLFHRRQYRLLFSLRSHLYTSNCRIFQVFLPLLLFAVVYNVFQLYPHVVSPFTQAAAFMRVG